MDGRMNSEKLCGDVGAPPSSLLLPAQRRRQLRWAPLLLPIAFVCLLCVSQDGRLSSRTITPRPHRASHDTANSEVCLDPLCVVAASTIIKNRSPRYKEFDPCENFDQYVCEGFDEQHDLRADQSALFTGSVMAENAQLSLRHLLESAEPPQVLSRDAADDAAIFDMLKDGYSACMDEATLRELGGRPMINVLFKIGSIYQGVEADGSILDRRGMEQKPITHTVPYTPHLSEALSYAMSIGLGPLVSLYVSPDDKDPDSVVPFLMAPRRPGLPSKEYYEDSDLVQRYTEMMLKVTTTLMKEAPHESVFSSASYSNLEWLVQGVVRMETLLAKVTPKTEEAEAVTFYYNPMALDEVDKLLPQVSIRQIIRSLAPEAPLPEKIIVGSPNYLQALSKLIADTHPTIVQAHIEWKALQAYGDMLEDSSMTPLRQFNNVLQGKDPDAREERWRTCVRKADSDLGWILSRFYIQKAFSPESKELGDKIVSDIKQVFVDKLASIRWMSDEVKELGAEKVRAIVQKIGYPTKSPDIRDATAVRRYYSSLHVRNDSYFGNVLSASKFETGRQWSALGKPVDRAEWAMTADTVNAYYNPPGNEIVFPAGIMQKPVFHHPSVPAYLSYGAFGAVSGHELSHAFDSLGRHYDVNGNYTDWWDNATVAAFEERAECFVDQYSKFTVENPDGSPLHVNGKLTLGENIADAGGLNAAFAAWKKLEAEKKSQLLPGLQDYSREQVFFMSYANFWCGKIRPETAVQLVYRDPHSPTWARILGTLANSRDFREHFNCPAKEPTCELW